MCTQQFSFQERDFFREQRRGNRLAFVCAPRNSNKYNSRLLIRRTSQHERKKNYSSEMEFLFSRSLIHFKLGSNKRQLLTSPMSLYFSFIWGQCDSRETTELRILFALFMKCTWAHLFFIKRNINTVAVDRSIKIHLCVVIWEEIFICSWVECPRRRRLSLFFIFFMWKCDRHTTIVTLDREIYIYTSYFFIISRSGFGA